MKVALQKWGGKTLAIDVDDQPTCNALYRIASVGGLLMGLFLMSAAYGHFVAVWPVIDGSSDSSQSSRLSLLLPGLLLVTTALINIGLCRVLWIGMRWALHLALVFNVLAAMYLIYLLLGQAVPDHPIGPFVALVSSYIILLAAIRLGLVWPASKDLGSAD